MQDRFVNAQVPKTPFLHLEESAQMCMPMHASIRIILKISRQRISSSQVDAGARWRIQHTAFPRAQSAWWCFCHRGRCVPVGSIWCKGGLEGRGRIVTAPSWGSLLISSRTQAPDNVRTRCICSTHDIYALQRGGACALRLAARGRAELSVPALWPMQFDMLSE